MENGKFLADYHTHTVFSHARGTAVENAAEAAKRGLRELAITDHGFNHKAYGIRKMDFKAYLKGIDDARTSFPKLNILRGVEANILNSKGDIDVNDEDYEWIDVLVCGHHKYVKGAGLGETFRFNFPVFWANLVGKSSAKRVNENTDAFIRMMDRHPIDIISHPNLAIRVDMKELARAAKHYNVFLELNGKGVRFSEAQAATVLEEGAVFIANSDAHSPNRVGDYSKIEEFILKAGIPLESIANYNKLPKFKEKRK